ncbi:MAG: hypothetical protein ACK5NY_10990 [Burkholderiaceae bacterium]|jgi:hypothetical protein
MRKPSIEIKESQLKRIFRDKLEELNTGVTYSKKQSSKHQTNPTISSKPTTNNILHKDTTNKIKKEVRKASDNDIDLFESLVLDQENLEARPPSDVFLDNSQAYSENSSPEFNNQSFNQQAPPPPQEQNEQSCGTVADKTPTQATVNFFSKLKRVRDDGLGIEEKEVIEIELESKILGKLKLTAHRSAEKWVLNLQADTIEKTEWLESQINVIQRSLSRELKVNLDLTIES